MTDSFASNRSIRAQLETDFDDYLGTIVEYLRAEYTDLQLPQELVDEIAATVIVRVSHLDPAPASLDAALFTAADEVMAIRRPQLLRASLSPDDESIFTSDIPASVPSLRLIQRPARTPHSNFELDASETVDSGRLSLANPPQDLRAALGLALEHRATNEVEQEAESVKYDAVIQPEPVRTAPLNLAAERHRPAPAEPTFTEPLVAPEALSEEQQLGQPTAAELSVEAKPTRTPSKAKAARKKPRSRATAKHGPPLAPRAPETSGIAPSTLHGSAFLPDEIAMVSVMGYPNNPKRAARLCVVALAEELGIEASLDLSAHIERVAGALQSLSSALIHTTQEPSEAVGEWQRVARRATLQAFFCDRI